MPIICCFIREQFFLDNPHFINMLDSGNTIKQSKRTHLCIQITSNGNNFYIPLRKNLGEPIRKYGRIGHAVPTDDKPKAGIDYRYTIIVNDDKYIEIPTTRRIPRIQYNKLQDDINDIETEFNQYLSGFIRVAKKNRVNREALYRESSLINFLSELGVENN